MQNWWYAKGGERRGPVSLQQLKELATSGEIAPADLVWTKGMPQWQPMRQVADLTSAPATPATVATAAAPMATAAARVAAPRASAVPAVAAPPKAAAPARPVAAALPRPIPEAPQAEKPRPKTAPDENGDEAADVASPVPARAVGHLRGHAPPTGDVVNWPITDDHFMELRRALEIRRRIVGAAHVYQVVLLLGLISGFLLAAAAVLPMATGAPNAKSMATFFGVLAAALAAASALIGVCGRFTRRSHQWAPLTIFVLCLALMAVSGYLTFEAFRGPYAPKAMDQIIQTAVGLAIGGTVLIVFSVISWRAFTAIPRYRNQPAWCQELVAAAGM